MTTEQIKDRSKTVTRRFGWKFLKPGDELWAVEKSMGLKPGEKVKRLAKIRVIDVREESLNMMPLTDCAKEGFPEMMPQDFMQMLINHYSPKVTGSSIVNRIEFEYLDT